MKKQSKKYAEAQFSPPIHPVSAGHHVFSVQLMDRYSRSLWDPLGVDRDTFLKLGQYPGFAPERFDLTAFAFRLAGQYNAVSKLHGKITTQMWQVLWPDKPEEQVPILSITNGVHLPSWQAPEVNALCEKYLASEWQQKQDEEDYWKCFDEIPDEELWQMRQTLKTRVDYNYCKIERSSVGRKTL